MPRKVIGIIGCGTIGSALAEAAAGGLSGKVEKVVLWDVDRERTGMLAGQLPGVSVASGEEELIDSADLVIEAVSPSVAGGLLRKAIQKKKDILIMSIGGLLGNEPLLREAGQKGIRVILPSGAVAGIDALKAAKTAGIDEVTITTRKPPGSLKGAPYLVEKGIETDILTGETLVFEGNAAGAVKAFPKNINVSALLSIAGIGAEKTKVRIVTSPEYTRNSHEIVIKGKCGTIVTRTENIPSPENPRTSYLAVLSAVASLKGYFDTVRIGT